MRTLNCLSPLRLFGSLLILAVLVIGVFMNFNCAPTAQQARPMVDVARQKAIQDSIRKVYEYELNKTWSTAFEHYKNKNYESAINPFWKVIELDTIERFKDQKYSLLSDSYIKLNKPDSAQIVLEMGVKKYPGNAYLHRTLAYFLDSRGQTEEAIQEYQKATEIDPSRPADWKALGNLYIKTNQVELATRAFEKVTELDPTDQDAQKVLSRLYKSTGDAEAAIKRMEEVKRLDPNNAENLFNLGREYFNLEDYNNAVLNLELMLKLKPNDPTAMEFLGNALQNRGDFRRAINVYNEILKLKPDHIKVMCDMATSYRELGQFSTARNYARQALGVDPKFGLARIVIGEIYESAAEKCYTARGKKMPEFDDKLIYDLAYQEYQKATQDPQFRELAERKMNYVNQSRPTKEDLFFHKGQTRPKDPCYDWIYK